MEKKNAQTALIISIVGIALTVISWFIPVNIGSDLKGVIEVTTISSVIIAALNIAGIALSIIGTVKASAAKKALAAIQQPAGPATAALVIGIVGIAVGAVSFFTCTMCTVLCACGTEAAKGAF